MLLAFHLEQTIFKDTEKNRFILFISIFLYKCGNRVKIFIQIAKAGMKTRFYSRYKGLLTNIWLFKWYSNYWKSLLKVHKKFYFHKMARVQSSVYIVLSLKHFGTLYCKVMHYNYEIWSFKLFYLFAVSTKFVYFSSSFPSIWNFLF